MKKTVIAIIVAIIILVGGAVAYKLYKHTQTAQLPSQTQPATQPSSVSPSSDNTGANGNTVDKSSSPQEQQAQQNLNSLDNGDHN